MVDIFLYKLEKTTFNEIRISKNDLNVLLKNGYFSINNKEFETISNIQYLKEIGKKIIVYEREINWDILFELIHKKDKNFKFKKIKFDNDLLIVKGFDERFIEININDFPNLIIIKETDEYLFKKIELVHQQMIDNNGLKYLKKVGNCNFSNSFNILKYLVLTESLNKEFLEKFDKNCIFFAWW